MGYIGPGDACWVKQRVLSFVLTLISHISLLRIRVDYDYRHIGQWPQNTTQEWVRSLISACVSMSLLYWQRLSDSVCRMLSMIRVSNRDLLLVVHASHFSFVFPSSPLTSPFKFVYSVQNTTSEQTHLVYYTESLTSGSRLRVSMTVYGGVCLSREVIRTRMEPSNISY